MKASGLRSFTDPQAWTFLAAAIVLVMLGAAGSARAGDDYNPTFDLWPILRCWDSDEGRGRNVEALWPVGEYHDAPARRDLAVRPLYNRRTDKLIEVTESEWPWPIGFGHHRRDLDRDILFPLFMHEREEYTDGAVQQRNFLLPLLFHRAGRGPTDLLIFPFGGVIHNAYGRERVVVVLWPFYIYQTRKGVESWDFPQPFLRYVKWEDGGRGYRFWPFYGINRRPEKLRKEFILWPFFQREYQKLPQGERRRWFFFPFIGHINDPGGYEWAALWPFFGKRYEQRNDERTWWYPWPLLGRRTGTDVSGWTFRPAWARERRGPRVEGQFLWPFGWFHSLQDRFDDESSLRLIPLTFIERERRTRAILGGVPKREGEPTVERRSGAWQLWPLVKHRWEADGAVHVELPSPLPVRGYAPYERNFAPFFRWLQYDRSPDGTRSYRLLWRVVRVDTGPQNRYVEVTPLFRVHQQRVEHRRSWSVLKGLVGVTDRPGAREYRFLYFITYLTLGPEPE